MPEPESPETRLREATDAVISSEAPRRLIVAGPGAGKTFLFRRLLENAAGNREEKLVFTFINNLKNDLDVALGHLAPVFTFHGYCRYLLHRRTDLRQGLTEAFHYYPALIRLISSDWRLLYGDPAPQFFGFMRDLRENVETDFYLMRSDYYNAISFDDSVFRVYRRLRDRTEAVERYQLVLVDEFQDFNRLEAEFIALLAFSSPIVIAGDDDQALYTHLRGSNPRFIRDLHSGGAYACFPLPYCMRCTEVVVGAVADIVTEAMRRNLLSGRIQKPYLHYPPLKGVDSQRYPRITVVHTSVQSGPANYFGRYIAAEISQISRNEISESIREHFPTVLIIGPKQYLRQIRDRFEEEGYACDWAEAPEALDPTRADGLRLIKADARSNLGWRIVLHVDRPPFADDLIIASTTGETPLVEGCPTDFRDRILEEARALPDQEEAESPAPVAATDDVRPTVKLTSFEGSKGLSGQHVFIVGLHEGDLPRDAARITDLEICKFLVALTRTRKQCHIVYTDRWLGQAKRRSPFLDWIRPERKEVIRVDRRYWQRRLPA